jgi:hypothetical protein
LIDPETALVHRQQTPLGQTADSLIGRPGLLSRPTHEYLINELEVWLTIQTGPGNHLFDFSCGTDELWAGAIEEGPESQLVPETPESCPI